MHLVVRILAQPVIEHEYVQDIQQLAFVFMDAFDLAVEDRVRIDDLAVGVPLTQRRKRTLAARLAAANLRPETRVVG